MMDHRTIDAEAVVERYVTGRLNEAETLAFEEHYLDCTECIERVEAAERLQRGLGTIVAHDAARTGLTAGVLAAMLRRAWLGWGLAGLALVGAVGLGSFVNRQRGQLERLQTDLAEARVVANAFEARAGAAEQDLSAAERARDDARRELELWRAPVTALPLALLTPLRGGEDVFELSLPRAGRWVGLWVELGGEELPAYRAILRAESGEEVVRADDLRLNALGALLLQLPAERLAAGRYTLTIADPRSARPLATFALVTKREP